MDYYKDLIAIQTIALVNAGLCDYHVRHCPPSKQLKQVCEEVRGGNGIHNKGQAGAVEGPWWFH
jgi:hypothetical protein